MTLTKNGTSRHQLLHPGYSYRPPGCHRHLSPGLKKEESDSSDSDNDNDSDSVEVLVSQCECECELPAVRLHMHRQH